MNTDLYENKIKRVKGIPQSNVPSSINGRLLPSFIVQLKRKIREEEGERKKSQYILSLNKQK
jgi:hypothetical protein